MNIISFGKSEKKIKHFTMHQHGFWEFLYQYEGKGEMRINGIPYPFNEGEVCIIPPHTPHDKKSKDGFIDISVIIKDLKPIGDSNFKIIKDDENGTLKQLFEMGYGFYSNQAEIDSNHRLSILNSIGDTIYSVLAGLYSASLSNINQPSLEGFLEIMKSNISDCQFNITEEIEKYGYNVVYFRRLFQKKLHTTPIAYMNQLRIEYAQHILDQYGNSLAIKDVAWESGFTDVSYFNRVYKKIVGTSPSQYLKNYNTDIKFHDVHEDIIF